LSETSNGDGLRKAYARVQEVKETHETALMDDPNVIGVGVGLRFVEGKPTDEVALIIMVRRKLPETLLEEGEMLPAELDGVPVDVQEVGDVAAH